MKIQRKIDVDIELSPEDLADCFCDLYADEQAMFFSHIAEVVTKWDSLFCFQLQRVINNKALTAGGRAIMRTIGEYGEEDNDGV